MKRVNGVRKSKIHRVGMSFTLIQKAVKTPRISKMLRMKREPQKFSFDRFALLAIKDWKYLRKRTAKTPMKINGIYMILVRIKRSDSYDWGDLLRCGR